MNISLLGYDSKNIQWYNQMDKFKQAAVHNFLLTMIAYHIAIFTSFVGIWLGISFYSFEVFVYILLLIYISNISIIFAFLKRPEVSEEYVKKMQTIQIANWLVLFSIWCFFMADQRAITLICAMMVMTFLFAYSTFLYSLHLNLIVAALYLVISYMGGMYFDHSWNVAQDVLLVIAFLLSTMMMGTMVHRTTLLLRRQAHNDFLTRLLNRRAMNAYIQEEFLRCKRFDTPVSLVMIDLDNFKAINDQYGHNCGDAVLVHVASELKQHIREVDHLARWGGEEFLALLIGVTANDAQYVIQRALKDLKQSSVQYGDVSIKVSFSAGISSLNDYCSAEASIQEADRLLYISKSEGKSRVSTAQGLDVTENSQVALNFN